MQDPERYLKQLGLGLSCVVDPSRPAILDSLHHRRINWESYFFADSGAMARFDHDPSDYCGAVTDPVLQKRFRLRDDSPSSDYDETRYYFTSDSTRQVFAANPSEFAAPAFHMVKDSTKHAGS